MKLGAQVKHFELVHRFPSCPAVVSAPAARSDRASLPIDPVTNQNCVRSRGYAVHALMRIPAAKGGPSFGCLVDARTFGALSFRRRRNLRRRLTFKARGGMAVKPPPEALLKLESRSQHVQLWWIRPIDDHLQVDDTERYLFAGDEE